LLLGSRELGALVAASKIAMRSAVSGDASAAATAPNGSPRRIMPSISASFYSLQRSSTCCSKACCSKACCVANTTTLTPRDLTAYSTRSTHERHERDARPLCRSVVVVLAIG
jgi:hypothetical protein